MLRLRPLWSNFDDLSPVMQLERENLYSHLKRIKMEKIKAEEMITQSIISASVPNQEGRSNEKQGHFFCSDLGESCSLRKCYSTALSNHRLKYSCLYLQAAARTQKQQHLLASRQEALLRSFKDLTRNLLDWSTFNIRLLWNQRIRFEFIFDLDGCVLTGTDHGHLWRECNWAGINQGLQGESIFHQVKVEVSTWSELDEFVHGPIRTCDKGHGVSHFVLLGNCYKFPCATITVM